jgi:hypothetical protein
MERKYPEPNRIVFYILSDRIRIFLSDFIVFVFVFKMFRISNVKVENFFTFNLKYSEFKNRFKPNLANYTGHAA